MGELEITPHGLPAQLWAPLLATAPELKVGADQRRPEVIVVVPHPDDESLGAGGLLGRLKAIGDCRVRVAFVTDGAAAYPGLTAAQADELGTLRQAEAVRALTLLGLEPEAAVFLDLPDGTVSRVEADLAVRLTGVLATAPEGSLCLAPWPDDPHPDHQAVGRAALLAAGRTGTELWQYPIWMRHSIQPDDPIVDVARLQVLRLSGPERSAKWAAIQAHASQLRSPFPGYAPVLPGHVLELFMDGLEPFFLPDPQ